MEFLSLLSFSNDGWGIALLKGALITLSLSLACLPIGLPLGMWIAINARSNSRLAKTFSALFSTVFRGLPELLTLLIIYYGCQILVQNIMDYIGFSGEFIIHTFVAAMIAFSFVFAAFSSEVWLGAFKTLPKGQYEAAFVLGISKPTTFFKIILPQLIRIAIPGLSNNWLSLLKDTSLVSTISLIDLMRQTSLAVSITKEPMFFYTVACLVYLLFSALSGRIFNFMETHYSKHLRSIK